MNSKQKQIWLGSIAGFLALTLFAASEEQDTRLREQFRELREARDEFAKIQAEIDRVGLDSRRRVVEVGDQLGHQLGQLWSTVDAESKLSRSAIGELTKHVAPDPHSLSNELLAPAVQLNGEESVGSGTLIYSRYDSAAGESVNYVLTAWHVVRDILREDPGEIVATIYQPGDQQVDFTAELVVKNVRLDSAVLKFASEKPFDYVAKVLSSDDDCSVDIWAPVYCVGCPLGSDPIPTSGQISSLRNMVLGANYWMINAPAYFGNSGGGIFLAEGRELIGVFSKVYTSGGKVVSHMGLITPITSIREWLADEDLDFVLAGRERETAPGFDEFDLMELELPSLAQSNSELGGGHSRMGSPAWQANSPQAGLPPRACEKRD